MITPMSANEWNTFFDIFTPPYIYFNIKLSKLHILNVVHFINVHKIIILGDLYYENKER